MTIADLRECPWFAHTAAHRLWKEWWRDERTFAHVRAKVEASVAGGPFPFTLIAQEQGTFIGTVSVVESNMEPRRDLSPWLSGLWVDESYRGRGWGSALLKAAIGKARANGRPDIYLTSKADRRRFYGTRGWRSICEVAGDIEVMRYSFDPSDNHPHDTECVALLDPDFR
ncbi:GNAT family N-acetyltransferase [Rhizobium sp. XQZ8]|uniref:GNAT family N-acetyltransferase n=1 Tax=Rhizobium populisoli TaxID=2859785 RepID=UPI001C676A3A|nr:GNAT family N-acetyltransferase [Rhizobium populisoli]MBW6426013.1 GNAT family N-acetyltransferase [Rhizobium populisoli]